MRHQLWSHSRNKLQHLLADLPRHEGVQGMGRVLPFIRNIPTVHGKQPKRACQAVVAFAAVMRGLVQMHASAETLVVVAFAAEMHGGGQVESAG